LFDHPSVSAVYGKPGMGKFQSLRKNESVLPPPGIFMHKKEQGTKVLTTLRLRAMTFA
jgi:hypothetical protein